jgi:ribosomal protein L37AE/L43A
LAALQIALLVIGVALLLVLFRRALTDVLQARVSRREQLRRLDAQAEKEVREAKSPHPCPLCGAETRFHRYPHIEVWRCVNFPECRGFVKARSMKRPAFAVKWERERGRR